MNTNSDIYKRAPKKESVVKGIKELECFVDIFLNELQNQDKTKAVIVGLIGDLGSGKTTFSKIVAEKLGVRDVVMSPTFVIQKQYNTQNSIFKEFVHMDVYRIEDVKEVGVFRFTDLFAKPNTLIFIEWPLNIKEVLPKDTLMVFFDFIDENTRKISY